MSKHKIKFNSTHKNRKVNYKWIFTITIMSFIIAFIFSYVSLILENIDLMSAIIILLIIILIGIFFDILGIAVAAAKETPFHSMASSRVIGARESIIIIRNAGAVANFFNDVIGDISGIISGSVAVAIVIRINKQFSIKSGLVSLLVTALIAAITIGGKALGKEYSLRKSNYIVYKLGIIWYYVNKMLGRK